MSSVFSNLKPRGSVGRNGFDLSRRSVFSAKCGMITPVFAQMTTPDSEYQIDLKQLLRTQPLQTAAFSGFSINYDFFFVPNNYGFSSFNEFIAQRKDPRHVGQPALTVPRFGFGEFLKNFIPLCVHDYIVSTRWTPLAYPQNDAVNINVAHYLFTSSNLPWSSVLLDVLRSLDMFGYGNYLPMVKFCAESLLLEVPATGSYSQWMDAIYENVHGTPIGGIGYDHIGLFMQDLRDAVQNSLVAVNSNLNIASPLTSTPTVWPFLAYNKAFYEFYRNIYYDDNFNITIVNPTRNFTYDFEYVQLFNFDDFSADYVQLQNSQPYEIYFCRLLAMFMPKCHQYRKDLFTGVLPSTQFGDVSMMVTDNDWRKMIVSSEYSVRSSEAVLDEMNVLSIEDDSPIGYTDGQVISAGVPVDSGGKLLVRFDPRLAISVLEQRRADAMQRFRERMLRAGNKVKDVFKAHGWSEPYSANEAMPTFLGTFDGRLDINTVAATTVADNQELGQLGANGTAVVGGKKLHFKCHDFGYIIGVMYIVKDAEYDAYGLERQFCLTDPFDYPYPELQNISLFPVDSIELSQYMRWPAQERAVNKPILGYLPRYMELKTAVDKVHGEFFSAAFDPAYDGYSAVYSANIPTGVFSDWVSPRLDINSPNYKGFLYQSPQIADNLFLVAANALQDTDQFLVNAYFDVKAVEPISVIGLPM